MANSNIIVESPALTKSNNTKHANFYYFLQEKCRAPKEKK